MKSSWEHESWQDDPVNEIFSTFTPESRCRFEYTFGSEVFVFPVMPDISVDELHRRGLESFPELADGNESDRGYFIRLMDMKRREAVGGRGMTPRNFAQLEQELPPIRNFLFSPDIKTVAFLGTGMSSAPLQLLPQIESGEIGYVLLVDMINIPALHRDSVRLRRLLQSVDLVDVPSTIHTTFGRLDRIMQAVSSGKIHLAEFFFEPGAAHPWVGQFDRLVNCWGPKNTTLELQLSMLSPGGMMALKPDPDRVPAGFESVSVDNPTDSHMGAIIWRSGTDVDLHDWPGLPTSYTDSPVKKWW